MPIALIFNPGSNSLKFELIEMADSQRVASEAKKLASAAMDDIGHGPRLSVYSDRNIVDSHAVEADDMTAATNEALRWLHSQQQLHTHLESLTLIGIRVVHGGTKYTSATRMNGTVHRDIERFGELAPLHNQKALDILDVLQHQLPDVPAFVTFDTAFHQTLPEKAWRYPIERETANRHSIRKFGFHGISHRYMLEHFAHTIHKRPEEITAITLHLEGGSSACAIAKGKSVDTTMGLTPLEGLMMGSRSGSIDPAIVPFLMQKEHLSADEVLTLLNKRSGLLGISGESVDTRVLEKSNDDAAKLALAMFSYRVRLAVGAYLAALGEAEVILFGGGIGVDSPWLRSDVCAGLTGWGLDLDKEINGNATRNMARLTKDSSRLHAWSIPVEEGLQIAHECLLAHQAAS